MKPYVDLFKHYASKLIEADGASCSEVGVWKTTKDLVLAFLSLHFEAGDWFAEDFVYAQRANKLTEKIHVQKLLDETPEECVVDRISLQARIKNIETEINELKAASAVSHKI